MDFERFDGTLFSFLVSVHTHQLIKSTKYLSFSIIFAVPLLVGDNNWRTSHHYTLGIGSLFTMKYSWLSGVLVAFFAIIVVAAAASAQYILAVNNNKFQRVSKIAVFFHVINGGIATLVGPFQFIKRIRSKWPTIHRWNGRFYLLNLILCYGSATVMLPYAANGSIGTGLLQGTSFLMMVLLNTVRIRLLTFLSFFLFPLLKGDYLSHCWSQ